MTPNPSNYSSVDHPLTPESQNAVDRLLEHGLDDSALFDSDHPLARLLSTLGTPLKSEDPSLIDITAVRATRSTSRCSTGQLELCPADEEALEALAREGLNLDRVPRALRDRARKLVTLQRVATSPLTNEGHSQLVSRTLSHVQSRLDDDSESLQLDRRRGFPGLRFADVVSVAAVMLIASSIVVPVFSAMRAQSTRTACQANMLATANAMGLYAGDYRGALPMTTAGFGGSWMRVGEPQMSNSANLYTLVRTQYAQLNDLACPGNRAAPTVQTDPESKDWKDLKEISYSYQIVSNFHPIWKSDQGGRSPIILADRSPVILRAAAGELINPWESSPNHKRRGQHILRTDGSSDWQSEAWPEGEDNIWLPRSIEVAIDKVRTTVGLKGTELPVDSSDTFLGP